MGIHIGTEFLGKVDSIGAESIQTKFFVIGGPIVPLESFYVLQESFRGVNGFKIGLHPKSVLLGYVRNWLFLPALLGLVFAIALGRDGFAWMLVPSLVLTAAWLVSWLAVGGLSAEEKKRRTILQAELGIAAPPELIPADVAMKLRAGVEAALSAEGVVCEMGSIASVDARLARKAWILARYSGWKEAEQVLWQRISSGTMPSAQPPASGKNVAISPR